MAAAFLAGLCVFNTVLNNLYDWGSTLFDSAIFATTIWHNDAALHMAPALGGAPFFETHFSPLLQVPNVFSYFFPGSRITYYGLVYGLGYAALVWEAFKLLLPLFPPRFSWLAGIGAFAFFCSQSVFMPEWEPRMEGVSPLFALLMLLAWQQRRYYAAIFWLVVSASMREDLGAIYALPLGLLALAQWYSLRRGNPALAKEKRRWGIRLVVLSVACSLLSVFVQKTCFPGFDLMQQLYFDHDHPFSHITGTLLTDRAAIIFNERAGMWLPLLALAAASIYCRDLTLLAGAIFFLPYAEVLFLSKNEMSATLDSYKSFPLALSILWPALLAAGRPELRQRYLWVQVIVLVCGLANMGPVGVSIARDRWLLRPYAYNASAYEDFGARLGDAIPKDANVRASRAILALYPYNFKGWTDSGIDNISDEDIQKITFFVWFDGDRDQEVSDKILKTVHFTQTVGFPGTKIHVAKR